MNSSYSRRAFLRTSTLAGGTVLLLPHSRLAFAAEANDKLNLAGIGVGGQGASNLNNFIGLGQNLVAFCDVDSKRPADLLPRCPGAKTFQDFRRMFDAMARDIDAVVVSTPDHTHAVAAVAAMNLGKHVFCEKPLTRTIYEARVMRETAARQKVVTQMGNQGSAENGLRRAVELVWNGTIGEVREAHIWFDGGNGPQKRPSETPAVPPSLDWDLWLGPAPERPYHPCYAPGSWRGWRAFGSGIVGDFGCHTGNLMFRALRLDQLWAPSIAPAKDAVLRVEAKPSEVDQEGYPAALTATVEIPARGDLPPVKLTIYAKEKPAEALMLGGTRGAWGDLLVGAKGSIYSECPWNTRFVLLPKDKFAAVKAGPPEIIPASVGHHREWVDACKGRGTTFSPFAIGGPLTELMQLVNLATLVEGPVEYHIASGRIRNSEPAQRLVHREYRSGWKI